VEIDYCPECNGIWLDNGELNKIVAASVQTTECSRPASNTVNKATKKSIFASFLDLMGTTKDDAVDGFDDDFISKP